MTPHKSGGRGTFIIDRVFPGVGRIRRASGTNDKRTFEDINSLLTTAYHSGRVDYLAAVRDARIRPLEHVDLYRMGGIAAIPELEKLPKLDTGFEWALSYEASKDHRENLAWTFRTLLKLEPNATQGDLPELLKKLKIQCRKAGQVMAFKRHKDHVLAFLADTIGREHPLYQQCRAIQSLRGATIPKRRGVHLTPSDALRLLGSLPTPHYAHAWSLLVTGMRTDAEYFSWSWDIKDQWVEIHGHKTAWSERIVPLVWTVTAPTTLYRAFQQAMQKHVKVVQPYDLRRTYSHWLEEAGIAQSRIEYYMGHAPGSQTAGYQRHNVEPYIQEDSKRIEGYLAEIRREYLAEVRGLRAVS